MHNCLRALALNLVAAVAVASTSACYTVEANLPGTLRNDVKPDQTESAGKLAIEQTNWFFIWGLVGAPPADFFSAEIKRQVQAKGADGVANLTYESQNGCVDLIVSGLTLGCIGPRTYKVTGDIVRIKSAPLPGKPVKSVQSDGHGGDDASTIAQSF